MIDEYLSHRARGNGEEVVAAGGVDGSARELQVGLVHERGRVQGVAFAFAAQLLSEVRFTVEV